MGLPRPTPPSEADVIRHDYLALLEAAIENFHESMEAGRNRDAAMQTFFSDVSEQIVIVVRELERLLSHYEARAFLMEQYLPKVAAFLGATAPEQ